VYRGLVAAWSRIGSARRLPVPVVSVGNLVAGGTGKTPAVLWLAEQLASEGRKPAILSRGYGGNAGAGALVVYDGKTVLAEAEQAGDEPVMLARRRPASVIVAGSDRYRCGIYAVEKLGAGCAILDDGFQHTGLHRDLNLLLLDSSKPFGNGRLLPAGTLREPKSAISRADMAIFTRWEGRTGGEADRAEVMESFGEDRVLAASHRYAGLSTLEDGRAIERRDLEGRGALLVSGIASPGSFEQTVAGAGFDILGHLRFADHHRYSAADIEHVQGRAAELDAACILTTEKDAVRLPVAVSGHGLPVFCVRIDLHMEKGLGTLREALSQLFL
jgi:tetraacyldisaccharide 4'-kinase